MNLTVQTLIYFIFLILLAGCSKKESSPPLLDISGTIQIDPLLAKHAKSTDVLFLIAKPAGGGPPVAVTRLSGSQYPYSFTLTRENLMMPDANLDVPLNLSVRVDKDGDASTKNSGDLFGAYQKNPVSLNEKQVVILINEQIP